MRITLRYFAAARERARLDREEAEVPEGTTAGGALGLAAERHPELASLLKHLRPAINLELGDAAHVLHDGDEVALIPPVAGGGGRCGIRETPLRIEDAIERISSPANGGVVTFSGAVRHESHGKKVVRLCYEAYAEMAERELERIAEEAHQRFGADVAIIHRIGALEIGELAVVIAAGAPHREPAFEACRYAIEELKKKVPIWKKETYEDGEEWVGLGP